jgi:hypothetical protein
LTKEGTRKRGMSAEDWRADDALKEGGEPVGWKAMEWETWRLRRFVGWEALRLGGGARESERMRRMRSSLAAAGRGGGEARQAVVRAR